MTCYRSARPTLVPIQSQHVSCRSWTLCCEQADKQFKAHKSLEAYNQSTSKVEYYDLCVWSIIFPRQVQASTLKGFILTVNSALIKRHTSSGLVLPETLGKCTQLRPSSVPLQTSSKTGGQIVQCSPRTLSSEGGVNQKLQCYCKTARGCMD